MNNYSNYNDYYNMMNISSIQNNQNNQNNKLNQTNFQANNNYNFNKLHFHFKIGKFWTRIILE